MCTSLVGNENATGYLFGFFVGSPKRCRFRVGNEIRDPVMWRLFYKTSVPKTNKSPIEDGSWKTILSFLHEFQRLC